MRNKEQSKKAFNEMAEEYDKSIYNKWSNKIQNKIINNLKIGDNCNLLDVGCGTGEFLYKIKNNKKIFLYGIDMAENMVKVCERKIKSGIFKVGEVENIPFEDNYFEVIVTTLAFHHFANPKVALEEMNNKLKENGELVIADVYLPNPFRSFVNKYIVPRSKEGDVKIYSRRELVDLIKNSDFHNVEFNKFSFWGYIIRCKKI